MFLQPAVISQEEDRGRSHFSRRHSSDGSRNRGSDTSHEQLNISTLKLKFSNRHKENDIPTNPKNTIFKNGNKSVEMTKFLPQRKKDKVLHQCQSLLKRSTASVVELT